MKRYYKIFIGITILVMGLSYFLFQKYQNSITASKVGYNTVPNLMGGSEYKNRKIGHSPPIKDVVYYSRKTNEKQVALTFDDGPDNNYTIKILDILKRNNIKATFFIVGKRAKANPQNVLKIVEEGHIIGNHTFDHPNLDKLTSDKIYDQVMKTENELYNITGIRTELFRPPYGAANGKIVLQLDKLGYDVIDWSVDTRDWAKTPVKQIMNYVKVEVRPGAIILQHCAGGKGEDLSNTVEALPLIINSLKAEGYKFVTVPELLDIPAYKK